MPLQAGYGLPDPKPVPTARGVEQRDPSTRPMISHVARPPGSDSTAARRSPRQEKARRPWTSEYAAPGDTHVPRVLPPAEREFTIVAHSSIPISRFREVQPRWPEAALRRRPGRAESMPHHSQMAKLVKLATPTTAPSTDPKPQAALGAEDDASSPLTSPRILTQTELGDHVGDVTPPSAGGARGPATDAIYGAATSSHLPACVSTPRPSTVLASRCSQPMPRSPRKPLSSASGARPTTSAKQRLAFADVKGSCDSVAAPPSSESSPKSTESSPYPLSQLPHEERGPMTTAPLSPYKQYPSGKVPDAQSRRQAERAVRLVRVGSPSSATTAQ